jgi:hypothetical protein
LNVATLRGRGAEAVEDSRTGLLAHWPVLTRHLGPGLTRGMEVACTDTAQDEGFRTMEWGTCVA